MTKRIDYALPLLLILSLVLTAPAVQSSEGESLGRLRPVNLSASCDDFRFKNHIEKSVKISVHGRLEVTLCSNPSTGYSWSDSAMISNHTVMWQTSHTKLPSTSSALGAPGKQKWTFQGLRAGKAEISLKYSRGGGGGSDNWTYKIDVTVIDPDKKTDRSKTGEKLVRGIFENTSNSNISYLESLVSKEFQAIHDSELRNRETLLQSLEKVSLGSYSLEKFKTTGTEKTLVVSYTVKADETLWGKPSDEPEVQLSVFEKTDSGWKWIAQSSSS